MLARLERRSTLVAWGILTAAMAAAAALVIWELRDLTFVPDELIWVQLAGAYPHDFLLHPYVGHLIVADLVTFKALLHAFGTDYRVFGVLEVGGLLLCAGLVFEFTRRRVGPVLALAPAGVLLFLGSSWNLLLQPLIGAQWMYSLAFGLAALLALEREDRPGDVGACLLLCLSLAWFTCGLAFLSAAAVSVLLAPDRRRRAWIFAVPLVLYAAYRIWATKFGGGWFSASNVPLAPLYVADALGAAAAAIFGRTHLVGDGPGTSLHLHGFDSGTLVKAALMIGVEIVVVVVIARNLRGRGRIPASLWVALAVPVALWMSESLGLAVNRTPGQNRYLFASVLALFLPLAEVARGVRFSRTAMTVVLGIAVLAVLGNAPRFREARRILVPYAERARAQMTVIELAGGRASPGFKAPSDGAGFAPTLYIKDGPWLRLVRRYGSPALPPGRLPQLSEASREATDGLSVPLLRLRLVPVGRPSAGRCRLVRGGKTRIELPVPPGGISLRPDRASPVLLRRVASRPVGAVGLAPGGRYVKLAIPGDRSPVPWRVSVPAATAVSACAS